MLTRADLWQAILLVVLPAVIGVMVSAVPAVGWRYETFFLAVAWMILAVLVLAVMIGWRVLVRATGEDSE